MSWLMSKVVGWPSRRRPRAPRCRACEPRRPAPRVPVSPSRSRHLRRGSSSRSAATGSVSRAFDDRLGAELTGEREPLGATIDRDHAGAHGASSMVGAEPDRSLAEDPRFAAGHVETLERAVRRAGPARDGGPRREADRFFDTQTTGKGVLRVTDRCAGGGAGGFRRRRRAPLTTSSADLQIGSRFFGFRLELADTVLRTVATTASLTASSRP